ncbi:MAG: type II toxin-antitoxin system Phd/YefM family antitoxin, partial [Elusimicrobia bacterium]|nr:type II toxin-antitoxin system Phd/YefM family antitoxin [Elusimicrobiota bacterium]
MKTIKALALRKRLGAILDGVVKTKEPVAVSRANQPIVVLLPYEQYVQVADRAARTRRLAAVAEATDRWWGQHAERL